jgi:hypothetical protein
VNGNDRNEMLVGLKSRAFAGVLSTEFNKVLKNANDYVKKEMK